MNYKVLMMFRKSISDIQPKGPSRVQIKESLRKKRNFKRSGLDTEDIITNKRQPVLKNWAKSSLTR